MICKIRRASPIAAMVASSLLLLSACSETRAVIGVSMKGSEGCQRIEYEYQVKVPREAAEPKSFPPEFCGLMPDRPDEITCFLWEYNGTRWQPLAAATKLYRVDSPHDHPDILCWEEELERWYEWHGGEDDPERDDEHLDPDAWPPYTGHPMWEPGGPIE